LYRLASFEDDKAVIEDGALWFTGTDPAGGDMSACIYPTGDNTFALEFALIDWDYIQSGDVFPEFYK